jgi:hypothetical protein
MPRLLEAIPPRSFELIRNRILDILIDEISYQQEITYDNATILFCLERSVPFNVNELAVINVSFAEGGYQNKNVSESLGTYTYNIDVHLKANASAEYEDPDSLATIMMHSLIGKCKAILANPQYNTLGYVPGAVVFNVNCSDIKIAEQSKQDMHSSAMGRLTVIVQAKEVRELIEAALLPGYETSITIDESSSGYKYSSD